YAPPPQFDPLLAKVIGTAGSPSVTTAVDLTRRALGEFHFAGLPTNIDRLRAILAHADVRAGDARTSLLSEWTPSPGGEHSATLALLAQQAGSVNGEVGRPHAVPTLHVGPGEQA